MNDLPYRIKMGEVFQLHNEAVILSCFYCAEEFEYFTEFTLHAQEHLIQLRPQNKPHVVLEKTVKNGEEFEIKLPSTSDVSRISHLLHFLHLF